MFCLSVILVLLLVTLVDMCIDDYPLSSSLNQNQRSNSRKSALVLKYAYSDERDDVVRADGPVLRVTDKRTNTKVTLVGVSHGSPASAALVSKGKYSIRVKIQFLNCWLLPYSISRGALGSPDLN